MRFVVRDSGTVSQTHSGCVEHNGSKPNSKTGFRRQCLFQSCAICGKQKISELSKGSSRSGNPGIPCDSDLLPRC